MATRLLRLSRSALAAASSAITRTTCVSAAASGASGIDARNAAKWLFGIGVATAVATTVSADDAMSWVSTLSL
ncbi:MAG: hypothetical protein P4L40_19110 [Terracidiphilus sp.]|nr:hypothetical protein [Terracidiphilus sp.]